MGLGGSKMLDDRRRRRLVFETELTGAKLANSTEESSRSSSQESAPPDLWLFLPQVVPQKLWKCWSAGAAAALTFLGLLATWYFSEAASASGSFLGDMIAPWADRLLRFGGAMSFWIACQMSCVVWWVRSRSRVDYAGRFHVWGWSAAGFFVASMLCLTDTHHSAAQIVAWSFTGAASNSTGVTALWLLPLSVAVMAWWATLGAEFRNDLSSRVLHSMSAISALSLMSVQLLTARNGVTTQTEFLNRLMMIVLPWCSLMSVWLHLRHVVHVTADPPSVGVSGWLSAWRYGPGRMVAALSRQPVDSLKTDEAKSIVRIETVDGTSQEVRIDEPEATPKGPSKRTRQAVRK